MQMRAEQRSEAVPDCFEKSIITGYNLRSRLDVAMPLLVSILLGSLANVSGLCSRIKKFKSGCTAVDSAMCGLVRGTHKGFFWHFLSLLWVPVQVGVLSGGEKARLAMAKFMLTNGTLLVLDEPTNHLDIPSKEMLESAIKTFQGAVIAVSHDRYFLRQIATRVITVSI